MKRMVISSFMVLTISTIILSGCVPNSAHISPIATHTPLLTPTSTPFVLPNGDFELSWDIYNNEYNSLGGILTIRRQGSDYTQTIVYSDGSCGSANLTVITENGEIKLTDRPDNYYGDFMHISSTGELSFIDSQGLIYSVPLKDNVPLEKKECLKSPVDEGKEFDVSISVISVDSIGNSQVKITLATNLPDGMKLMIDFKNNDGYWAQDDPAVSGGELVTTLGNVKPGTYTLFVSSIVVSLQPDNVKAILGENGKNLVGDLIVYDQTINENFIEYETIIEIK